MTYEEAVAMLSTAEKHGCSVPDVDTLTEKQVIELAKYMDEEVKDEV